MYNSGQESAARPLQRSAIRTAQSPFVRIQETPIFEILKHRLPRRSGLTRFGDVVGTLRVPFRTQVCALKCNVTARVSASCAQFVKSSSKSSLTPATQVNAPASFALSDKPALKMPKLTNSVIFNIAPFVTPTLYRAPSTWRLPTSSLPVRGPELRNNRCRKLPKSPHDFVVDRLQVD
jgi:hypothetical protein